jgi:hypothetical protein
VNFWGECKVMKTDKKRTLRGFICCVFIRGYIGGETVV